MSVNVSKRQVAHPGFVDCVRRILQDTGVDGSNVKLEITESVIMENPDSITEVLDQAQENNYIANMKVGSLLPSLPGMGKIKAKRFMEEHGIADNRRIRGLGSRQRAAILDQFA